MPPPGLDRPFFARPPPSVPPPPPLPLLLTPPRPPPPPWSLFGRCFLVTEWSKIQFAPKRQTP